MTGRRTRGAAPRANAAHDGPRAPLATADGVAVAERMRVYRGRRGSGTVLRVISGEDGVVVRWDGDVPEPGKTTVIPPTELSGLSAARVSSSRAGRLNVVPKPALAFTLIATRWLHGP